MSEIQGILQSNGAFKSEMMEAFLCNRLNATTLTSVDSEGNLMTPPSPTTTIPSTTQSVNTNNQAIDNRPQFQNDNFNKTTTTASDNNNRNGNGNGNTQSAAASNVTDPNANTESDVLLLEVQKPISSEERQLIKNVTEAIVSNHLETCLNTYQNVADAERKIDANMAAGNMPDMSKMAGNASCVWQKFVSQMVPEITKAVKFCNRLPGFSQIKPEDKMVLIKQASFEILVTRFCMLINTETGDMIDPSLSIKFPRQALQSMPMGQLLMEFYKIAEKFNPLALTDGEIGLFTSILVMSPDRAGSQSKADVDKIQGLFKQAIYLQLKENHTDADSIYTKLMATIPIFREINEKHTQALSKMKMAAPEEFSNSFPSLHQEMYSQ
ncbi:nuclear receptor ROR-beta [Patella vulgata]|uniref:nuclear receptor ROR-beta n=1 Tax=Patella vulgata TaxID=6465 RepID=UPI00217F4563|nr:nuclear receptor ROR-beta [Patella vulgata]